jgi:hypothetical protein
MSRFWIICCLWVVVGAASAQPLSFDPKNPLPGKKAERPNGPRAIVPALLSLTLSGGGTFLAYKVIVEEARFGKPLPSGSLVVASLASVYPSVGRLLVPQNHTMRSAILLSSGRLMSFALFYSSIVGVSRGAQVLSEASFLTLSVIDVVTTARLRFPGEPRRVSWVPVLLPEERLGLGVGGQF